eukprot:jgi/Chrzof1/4300/Cz14g08030.t1
MAASRPPCIEASEMSFIQMVRTDDLAVAGDRPIAADADVAIVDPDVADSQFEFMTNLAAEAVTLDASWLVENSFTAPQPVGTVLQLASSLSPMDVDQKEGTNEHRWRLRLKLDYEETVKVEVKPVESSSKTLETLGAVSSASKLPNKRKRGYVTGSAAAIDLTDHDASYQGYSRQLVPNKRKASSVGLTDSATAMPAAPLNMGGSS